MGFKPTGGGGGVSGIPPSSFTAKGQLLIATGNGTFTEHAVPATPEQTIVADPTTTDGWSSDFPLDRGEAYARPTGAIAETFSRRNQFANVAATASGSLFLTAIFLSKNKLVSNISFLTGTSAVVTPTNQWFALVDNAFNLLGQTVDDTTNAWSANTLKTLALTATYTTTYAGLYYVGYMVAAATTPSMAGFIDLNSAANTTPPIMSGVSTGGLTTPASLLAVATPNPGSTKKIWSYVS